MKVPLVTLPVAAGRDLAHVIEVAALNQRLNSICSVRTECDGVDDNLHLWNLRGHNSDISLLRPKLEEQLARYKFGLIILDPAYKVLGNRDENANGEIASLMNEFEAMAQKTGAAIVVAHHFAKGDSTAKSALDQRRADYRHLYSRIHHVLRDAVLKSRSA